MYSQKSFNHNQILNQMKNSIKNQQLIQDAQKGNQKAINKLFDIYMPMVTFHIKKYKLESIEDASMEIMGKALHNIGSFDFTNEFSTWVYKISENHCIDIFRKNKIKTVSIYDQNGNGKEYAENVTDYSISAHQRVETDEKISTILTAIEKLSENQRKCLLMQIEGFSIREIALETQLNENNIKTLLSRAKEKLSKMQLS